MRKALLREPGGDRLMVKILALVPSAGLEEVLVAVELALERVPPSGRISEQHVINVLARLRRTTAGQRRDTTAGVECCRQPTPRVARQSA